MLTHLLRQHLPDWLRPFARKVRRALMPTPSYAAQLEFERANFDKQTQVHELPPIFHYWSNTYLRPMLEEFGFSNPDQFFVKYLLLAASRTGRAQLRFLSIGAGNCDTEVRIAQALRHAGLDNFCIDCLELSPVMLARGHADAQSKGVGAHLKFTQGDFNNWRASTDYDSVLANQSLHHVSALEHLFDAVKSSLHANGLFLTSDIIGRNGHMRWPESLAIVQRFWQELPESYRYNQQLRRHEKQYKNWDCSHEGFEGIRAQDVLPEMIKRFNFKLFIAASSVVDIFIDRSFGHHFNVNNPRDTDLIDRIHAYDEQALASVELTPTRLFAVMTLTPETSSYSRGLRPENCVRRP